MENKKQTNQISENKKEGMNSDQKSFLKFIGIVIVVLLTVMIFRFYGASANNSSAVNGNVVAANNGDVQTVKMYVENGKYILEPSSFKVGIPIKIVADMSQMPGCSKSIVIPAFNVRKSLSTSDNIIQFTPNKAGTFNIACSMNMYKGTFTVLEANGAKSNYVEKAPSGGMSCGGGGSGGCGGGCGG